MADYSVEQTLDMNWEVESEKRSWYRIEGICTPPSCSTGLDTGDPACGGCKGTIQGQPLNCGAKYVQVIPAKSVAHLCELLQSPQPPFYVPAMGSWAIKSIRKYNLTERLSDLGGKMPNCTQLEEQDFASIPECAQFVPVTSLMTLQSTNYTFQSTNNLYIEPQASEVQTLATMGVEDMSWLTLSMWDWTHALDSIDDLVMQVVVPSVDDPIPTLSINTETVRGVSDCNNYNWPLRLAMDHNFDSTNIFKQFALKNSISFTEPVDMLYTTSTHQWQGTIHMSGLSSTGSEEIWTWTFQFQNTNELEGELLGQKIWKLTIQIMKKSVVSGESKHSKIVLATPQGTVCAGVTPDVNFSINTLTGFATMNSGELVVDYSIIYDEIGLFNSAWRANPVLRLNIAEVKINTTSKSVEFNSIFPASY